MAEYLIIEDITKVDPSTNEVYMYFHSRVTKDQELKNHIAGFYGDRVIAVYRLEHFNDPAAIIIADANTIESNGGGILIIDDAGAYTLLEAFGGFDLEIHKKPKKEN